MKWAKGGGRAFGGWFLLVLLVLFMSVAAARAQRTDHYFAIQVVDADTGRGVPLVELRTVNEVRYYTDSNGIAAIDEPGLNGQEVFFHVKSHGYEVPADGFGYRGVRLKVKPGGSAQIRIQRLNIAERLYRVTGAGIYRDSILVGHAVPTQHPLLNGEVLGQDSVLNAVYKGRLFWVWGDTNQPSFPLGNFNSTAATSSLPGAGGLPPEKGVDLTYFTQKSGFVKGIAPVPGSGPTWLDSLVTLPENGQDRLFAAYAKVRQNMAAYQRGLLRFDDAKQQFEPISKFDINAPLYPHGNPVRWTDNGVQYLYFSSPYPLVRVPATAAAFQDLSQYEGYTCLQEGSRFDPAHPEAARIDLDSAGHARYSWKKNTPPVGPGDQERLIKAGRLKPGDALLRLQDVETGKPVFAHAGSVYFNPYRKRWIMITVQAGGTSYLGEVWYAEAPTPEGPWLYAKKVVTHDTYSFYNPKLHPEFEEDGGKTVYFEGTYASTFSGNPVPTPRYDYNQMMYRLDLADPRLSLPSPVTEVPWAKGPQTASFFAADHAGTNLIPLFWRGDRLVTGQPASLGEKAVFYALPAAAANPPATSTPLYEFVSAADGSRTYSVEAADQPGFKRTADPVCRVWRP